MAFLYENTLVFSHTSIQYNTFECIILNRDVTDVDQVVLRSTATSVHISHSTHSSPIVPHTRHTQAIIIIHTQDTHALLLLLLLFVLPPS